MITTALIVSMGFNYYLYKKGQETAKSLSDLKKEHQSLKKDHDFLIEMAIQQEKERAKEIKAAKELLETAKLYKAYQAYYTNKEIGET